MILYFWLAIRSLVRNWRHSLAAVLSVAVGFASLALFSGYIKVVEEIYEDNYSRRNMFGHVLIEKTENGRGIDFEDSRITPAEQNFAETFFRRQKSYVNHTPVLIVEGLANNGKTSSFFWGFAYDVKRGAHMRQPTWGWMAKAGKPLDMLPPDRVILGQDIAETFDCFPEQDIELLTKVGGYAPVDRPFKCRRDRIQFTVTTDAGQINAEDMVVGGLGGVGLRDVDAWYALMPIEMGQRLLDTDAISHYRVQLREWEDMPGFVRRFNEAASANGMDVRASDWRTHILARVYMRTMGMFNAFRVFVTAVIITISGMSVLNAMIKNVNERLREIGTLRSLGFRSKEVLAMFSMEGLVIGMAGSAIGSIFSLVGSLSVNAVGFTYLAGFLSDPVPFVVGLSPFIYFLALTILSGISVFTTYLAARRAVTMSIPACLGAV